MNEHNRLSTQTALRAKGAFKVVVLAVAFAAGVSACAQRDANSTSARIAAFEARNPAPQKINNPAVREINRIASLPADQIRNYISGKTVLSYAPGHGNQVEFLDPQGGAHLWYPGNLGVVHGNWDIQSENGKTRVCFKYGKNTYNPETGRMGGEWECTRPNIYFTFQIDRMAGDPFSLETADRVHAILAKDATKPYIPNELPFPLPHRTNGKTPLEHLLEDTGVGVGT
jgi:hypothetical protein